MSAAPRPGEQHVASACPLDCPDACSLDVTLSDGRVVADRRQREEPGHARLHLRQGAALPGAPLRRRRVSRIRASGRAARARAGSGGRRGTRRSISSRRRCEPCATTRGAEGILPLSYGGSNGYLSQDTTDARLFYRLGASRLAADGLRRPVEPARRWGCTARWPGVAYQDYAHASLIVVWGMNPSVSGIHLVPYIQEAQKRGARLVVVDPRRTRQAEHADLHLPIHPGTDLPLALSIIRWLFAEGRADRGLSRRARARRRRARAGAPSPGRSSARRARRGVPAADIEALRAALRGRFRPRRCAAAGGPSAAATGARRPRRSWPCRRWPASSACAAAATRSPTRRRGGKSTAWRPRRPRSRRRARST